MRILLALSLLVITTVAVSPAFAANPNHPKPHKVKKHKAVQH
jgi:hypothetical protein